MPTSSKADVKEPEDEQQVDDMKQERSDCKYSYKWLWRWIDVVCVWIESMLGQI